MPRVDTITMSSHTPQRPQTKAKRARSSPTGKTPKQVIKRPAGSRRKLTYVETSHLYPPPAKWTDADDEQLTQFNLLNSLGDSWPATKSSKFWEQAARFLYNTCGSRRTSKLPSSVQFVLSVMHHA